jgi:hypothetical protein
MLHRLINQDRRDDVAKRKEQQASIYFPGQEVVGPMEHLRHCCHSPYVICPTPKPALKARMIWGEGREQEEYEPLEGGFLGGLTLTTPSLGLHHHMTISNHLTRE